MPPEGYTWSDFINVPQTMDDLRADYERMSDRLLAEAYADAAQEAEDEWGWLETATPADIAKHYAREIERLMEEREEIIGDCMPERMVNACDEQIRWQTRHLIARLEDWLRDATDED